MNNPVIHINGKNAMTEWGVLTTPNTLSALLMPPSMKENVTNTSRLEHGTRIDTSNPKVAQRELNLEIQMIADTEAQFYARHESFCTELQKGAIDLYMSDRPSVIYHLVYNSCSQYTQFRRGIATLSLKVTEPNPKDRRAHNG